MENKKENPPQESLQNLEWLRDNYDTLQQEYDNQWIIIEDQKVVNNSKIFKDIIKAAAKNKKTALVEFITSEQMAMFF